MRLWLGKKSLELSFEKLALVVLAFFAFFWIFLANLLLNPANHYAHLAYSFLNGRLDFVEETYDLGIGDTSSYEGKLYWPLGLLPGVLLMPFVAVFGPEFPVSYLTPFLVLATVSVLFEVFKWFVKDLWVSLFLVVAYVIGSSYMHVALVSMSWYFAHIVGTFCIAMAIYFSTVKSKPFLSGFFLSLAFLTRVSLVLNVLFFVLFPLMSAKEGKKRFFGRMVRFFMPLVFGTLVFFAYNFLRFDSFFETGYSLQFLPDFLMKNRELGMWSVYHLPTNFFLFFLMSPTVLLRDGTFSVLSIYPNALGMSFLYTTPIFLYLLKLDLRDRLVVPPVGAILPTLVFLLGSFGLGAQQYGYRFALDFQPFVFVLLCLVFAKRGLKRADVIFLLASAAANTYLISNYNLNWL